MASDSNSNSGYNTEEESRKRRERGGLPQRGSPMINNIITRNIQDIATKQEKDRKKEAAAAAAAAAKTHAELDIESGGGGGGEVKQFSTKPINPRYAEAAKKLEETTDTESSSNNENSAPIPTTGAGNIEMSNLSKSKNKSDICLLDLK